jgi:ATP-dependent DNA helicase HFM1/MER3
LHVATGNRFGEEFRPVKLEVKVLGFPSSKNDFLFDRNLNYKLGELIRAYSDDKPSLIVGIGFYPALLFIM